MIDVPLRVLMTVTGLSLTKWLDLISLKHACGDETIYTVLDQACKKLGLLPPVRTLERKIPFSSSNAIKIKS